MSTPEMKWTPEPWASEILTQWAAVLDDRCKRQECLERTGPGESPYTRGQDEAWTMREHCLSRTLLASMPEIAPLLQDPAAEIAAMREALRELVEYNDLSPNERSAVEEGASIATAGNISWGEHLLEKARAALSGGAQ